MRIKSVIKGMFHANYKSAGIGTFIVVIALCIGIKIIDIFAPHADGQFGSMFEMLFIWYFAIYALLMVDSSLKIGIANSVSRRTTFLGSTILMLGMIVFAVLLMCGANCLMTNVLLKGSNMVFEPMFKDMHQSYSDTEVFTSTLLYMTLHCSAIASAFTFFRCVGVKTNKLAKFFILGGILAGIIILNLNIDAIVSFVYKYFSNMLPTTTTQLVLIELGATVALWIASFAIYVRIPLSKKLTK